MITLQVISTHTLDLYDNILLRVAHWWTGLDFIVGARAHHTDINGPSAVIQTHYLDIIVGLFLLGIVITWLSRRWITYKLLHPDYFPRLNHVDFNRLSIFPAEIVSYKTEDWLMKKDNNQYNKMLLDDQFYTCIKCEDANEGYVWRDMISFLNNMKPYFLLVNILPLYYVIRNGYWLGAILLIAALVFVVRRIISRNKNGIMTYTEYGYMTEEDKIARAKLLNDTDKERSLFIW